MSDLYGKSGGRVRWLDGSDISECLRKAHRAQPFGPPETFIEQLNRAAQCLRVFSRKDHDP